VGASPLLQLFLAVSAFAWFVTLIGNLGFAIGKWSEFGLKALVPALVCLLTIPVSYVVGHAAEAINFNVRLLPRFEKLVAEIEKTNIASEGSTVQVPSEAARIVLARRNDEHQLQVEFITRVGFPVKHSGYLYVENDDIESDAHLSSRWPHVSKVKPQWFRVAD
jgi:hypothetical protein